MRKPEPETRNQIRILVLIFLLAVTLRTVAVLLRPMVQLDEAVYARLAENLAAGKGFVDLTGVTTVHFAPLFPLIVAALTLVTGNAVAAGYVVVVFFGSLITVATYLLGRDMFGGRIGLMAAALVAVMPLLVDYSSRLYSESVYVFFLMLALFFGWRMLNRPRWQSAAWAGVTLGIAYLTNPSPFYYSLLFLALAVAVGVKQGILQKMAKAAAVFAVVFFVIVLPNVILVHSVSGNWTFTGKKAAEHIFTVTHNLRYGTPEWDREAMTLADDGTEEWVIRTENSDDIVSFFIHQPATAAKMFASQSYLFYSRQIAMVLPLWLLPLLGLGLFSQSWEKRWKPAIGFIAVMLAPVLVILAMYPTDRFFMPFVPLVLILVSLGWRRWEEWGRETVSLSVGNSRVGHTRRLAVWAIGALVILPVAVFGLGNIAATNYDTQYREAGEWIGANAGEGKVIMARWEASSSYYAGGIAVPLPYAEYDRLNAYARSKGVDYLVIGSEVIREFRPQMSQLLGAAAEHPDWRLVQKVRPGTDSEVLIFQLVN